MPRAAGRGSCACAGDRRASSRGSRASGGTIRCAAPMTTEQKRAEVGEVETFWREAPGSPVLYLHGVPTDGDDWLPFLERSGGFAPDLPGFGRSDKPPHFDYSIEGYARWLR